MCFRPKQIGKLQAVSSKCRLIHSLLVKNKYIYVNYSACRVSDYVKVLQCYKCLAFGHFAKHCRFTAICGHCAGGHELRECASRNADFVCGNCKRWTSFDVQSHSALNITNCPILWKRMADRVKHINYE